ncbi:MAG: hypothetical protein ACLU9S_13925 [Oscillospiraceae bacterium]
MEEIVCQLPERLLPWFAEHRRDLPWRQDREPYHIWVSEIMLAADPCGRLYVGITPDF